MGVASSGTIRRSVHRQAPGISMMREPNSKRPAPERSVDEEQQAGHGPTASCAVCKS